MKKSAAEQIGIANVPSRKKGSIPPPDGAVSAYLRACISPASFMVPEQIDAGSAWLEHAPFAFWLVETLRPRTVVELGTQRGFSYFAFCQAVQRVHLETRCYAVDTWRGDHHAGFYGDEVYREVRRRNAQRYAAFSNLIRSSFDDASRHFADGSIDLLHIDGRHFFDDVKHDFETWREKLSNRAVVLFHDTNVHERDFGVFKIWNELCLTYPHFEFMHGHGLGILGIGKALPPQVLALFAAQTNSRAQTDIRRAYSRLGSAVAFQFSAERLELTAELKITELSGALSERDANVSALEHTLSERDTKIRSLEQALSGFGTKIAVLEHALTERVTKIRSLEHAVSGFGTKIVALERALSERDTEIHALEQSRSEFGAKIAALNLTLLERNNQNRVIKQALSERDAKIQVLARTLSERNSALEQACSEVGAKTAFLDHTLAERNSTVAALQEALSEARVQQSSLQCAVEALHASTSWRATTPLRVLKQVLGRCGYSAAGYHLVLLWKALKTRFRASLQDRVIAHSIANSAFFDRDWYLANYPDVAALGIDPIRHYVSWGAREGRNPSPSFSAPGYLETNPDLAASNVNPLLHFVIHGRTDKRGTAPINESWPESLPLPFATVS